MSAKRQDVTKDLQERTKLGEFAGLLTVAVNLMLVAAKSAVLFLSPSAALGADVQGGLSDVLSGIFSYLGFRLSRAAPRGRFVGGFSRAESLGTFSTITTQGDEQLRIVIQGRSPGIQQKLRPLSPTATNSI